MVSALLLQEIRKFGGAETRTALAACRHVTQLPPHCSRYGSTLVQYQRCWNFAFRDGCIGTVLLEIKVTVLSSSIPDGSLKTTSYEMREPQ